MRSTITLNGQESSDIEGLLIQSLPPISKPLMRTQIEEIDGRDGDVITKLGFSAYTKQITIGLYGDFDIDEVIAYFNSEGTVIFSNEPDKYYYYQIIDQIDFERLIRFRTATVTFHVQPFKYAVDQKARALSLDLLPIPNFTKTTNGITLTSQKGAITITGTGSAATEFYVPISSLTVPAGNFTLSVTANGDGCSAVSARLIKTTPSNADSFGGGYITLSDGESATISDELEEPNTYNYLWFYIAAGTELEVFLTAQLENDDVNSVTVKNSGNIYSKPQITMTGIGTVNLSLNGNQLFVINFGSSLSTITIDTNAMEAYGETPETLMNRSVDGDYNNFKLNVGSNTVSWSGNLASISFNKYSRWI